MKIFVPVLLMLPTLVLADVPEHQQAEVTHLLDFVTASDCVMIRNGKEHGASEARKHIERKYRHFVDEIDSTESFIELSASKSLFSGDVYEVDCSGERMTSRQWLLDELQRYRNS